MKVVHENNILRRARCRGTEWYVIQVGKWQTIALPVNHIRYDNFGNIAFVLEI